MQYTCIHAVDSSKNKINLRNLFPGSITLPEMLSCNAALTVSSFFATSKVPLYTIKNAWFKSNNVVSLK